MKEPSKHKTFQCPNCEKLLVLQVAVEILGVVVSDKVEVDWKDSLTEKQKLFLDHAANSGIMSTFEQVVKIAKPNQIPVNVERFFFTVFKTAAPKTIPKFALRFYIEKFGGKIEFWSAQQIGIVVSDGQVKAFVPVNLVSGINVRDGSGGTKATISADEFEFDRWNRTKFGYVPRGNELFMDALRKKAIGDFAKPAL